MSASPVVPVVPVRSPAERAERAYRDAWLSLLLFVVSLAVSLVVFIVVARAVGWTTLWSTSYPAGRYSPSGWSARGLWLLMTVLFAWPEILVVRFARRAARLGRPEWLAPVILGAVLAALLPVLNFALLVG